MSNDFATPGSDAQDKTSESNAVDKAATKKPLSLVLIHKKLAKDICQRLKEHNFTAYHYNAARLRVETVIMVSQTEHVHAWIDFSDVRSVRSAGMEFIVFSLCSNKVYDVKRYQELVEFINLVNSESLWAKLWLEKTLSSISIEYAIPYQAFSSICAGHIVMALLDEFCFWSEKAKMVDAGMSAQDAFDAP